MYVVMGWVCVYLLFIYFSKPNVVHLHLWHLVDAII